MDYGRNVLGQSGNAVQVSMDGRPEWKPAGITLDWSTVTAVGADTTLADGNVVKAGNKYLLFGTVLNQITASGLYGPANTSLTNGQQTLAVGKTFILNETVMQNPPLGLGAAASDHPAVFDGGLVWTARLQVGGANQPTLAALLAALPRLKPGDIG